MFFCDLKEEKKIYKLQKTEENSFIFCHLIHFRVVGGRLGGRVRRREEEREGSGDSQQSSDNDQVQVLTPTFIPVINLTCPLILVQAPTHTRRTVRLHTERPPVTPPPL